MQGRLLFQKAYLKFKKTGGGKIPAGRQGVQLTLQCAFAADFANAFHLDPLEEGLEECLAVAWVLLEE